MEVSASVKNVGFCFSGREVVQVYLSCPQKGDARELRRLAGFAKTLLLAPEQSQTLTISIPQKVFASFSEEKQGWMVEKGLYGIWIGNSSAALTPCAVIRVGEDVCIEKTHPSARYRFLWRSWGLPKRPGRLQTRERICRSMTLHPGLSRSRSGSNRPGQKALWRN